MLTGTNKIVHECPLRVEFNGRIEVFKLQLDATACGHLTVVMRNPETDEFLGEWDRECGGGIHMFGVDIDKNEKEYLQLETILFHLIDPIFPYFFDYDVKKIMANRKESVPSIVDWNKVAELLKKDPAVDASTVQIEDDSQVIFYTKGDPEEDPEQQPSFETQRAIEALGGFVHMNDCEGCYNEGVVWSKDIEE